MGVHNPTVMNTTLLTTVLTQNTETAFLTTPGINLSLDNAQVLLFWWVNLGTGGSTTGIQITVRRGADLTGAIVIQPTVDRVTAATNAFFSGVFVDTPGIVANQQYTFSALQVAAAVNGSFNLGCALAMVL